MFAYTKYLKNYKRESITAPIFKWIEAVFELFVPIIAAAIIDKGIPTNNKAYILSQGALLVALGAFGLWFALICQKNASIAAQGFGTNLRNELYSHILKLSLADIEKIGSATLNTAMTNDIYQMEIGVSRFMRIFVRAPFLVAGAIVMTFFINTKIAVVMLIFSVVCGAVLYFLTTMTVKHLRKNQQYLEQFSQITSENLTGAKAVKAFGKQEYEKSRFLKIADKLYTSSMKYGEINSYLKPLSQVIINLGIVVIVYMGSFKINGGTLSAGKLIAVVNYMLQILNALAVVILIMGIFSRSHTSSVRVAAILAVKPEKNNADLIAQKDFKNAIDFKNVSFSYLKDGKYQLQDITFSIPKNSSLGIIGGTGSGKSTLISLIKGLYKTDSGSIFICGTPICEYTENTLPKIVAASLQDAKLFEGSIRSNLLAANKDATDEMLDDALKIASAYDFVMSKSGLDTLVAQNGSNFSGGQKQRLSIARALAAQAQILILDDSFSALDNRTSKAIKKAIEKNNYSAKIIISQRIADVKICDNIILLKDGKILAQGTHNELKKSSQQYSEICKVQEEK